MKKILFTALLFVLMASPALATSTPTSTPTTTPIVIGGLVHYNKPLISRLSFSLEGDTVVANVLTTKFMSCGIITSEESQQFAINSDSLPVIGNGLELFGSSDTLFGYSNIFGQEGTSTFRTLTAPKANYFRVMCDYHGKPIVSTEYSTVN